MTVNAYFCSLVIQIMKLNPTILFFSITGLALAQAQTTLLNAEVEGQPLGANAGRVVQALELLGAPLATGEVKVLKAAIDQRDAVAIQKFLDPHVLVVVSVNPELRVKVRRGRAKAELRQGGFTPARSRFPVGHGESMSVAGTASCLSL